MLLAAPARPGAVVRGDRIVLAEARHIARPGVASATRTAATATTAAVSIRRTCGESETRIAPACSAAASSPGLNPPSGPIKTRTTDGDRPAPSRDRHDSIAEAIGKPPGCADEDAHASAPPACLLDGDRRAEAGHPRAAALLRRLDHDALPAVGGLAMRLDHTPLAPQRDQVIDARLRRHVEERRDSVTLG